MKQLQDLWDRHPYLVSWVLLAIGMVVILLIAAQDVPLLPSQRMWLVVATIGLAGLCVWIIQWEDDTLDGDTEPPT